MLVAALGGPPTASPCTGRRSSTGPRSSASREKMRRCAFVVAISSFGRSQLYRWCRRGHWPKIQVVHCGLDAGFLAARRVAVPAAPRLVCVGRLCEQKGQLLLIEAAARSRRAAIDFELVLAGDGEMRPEIEALIARHRPAAHGAHHRLDQQRRRCATRSSRRARWCCRASPRACRSCSWRRWRCAGRSITTYVAGIPELVRPGEHGWLVPAGDVEALADAMYDCLDTPVDILTRMGETARERVLRAMMWTPPPRIWRGCLGDARAPDVS